MKQLPYYGYPLSSIIYRFIYLFSIILLLLISIYNSNSLLTIFSIILFFIICYSIISFKKNFNRYREKILNKMIENANLIGDEFILDLGTGSGFLAIGFAKHLKDGKIYGLDKYKLRSKGLKEQIIYKIKINFFGNTLANAKRNAEIEKVEERCEFIAADITKKINFPNKTFNIIITSQCLYCIPINKQEFTFNEINRLLKNNGKIVFFESRSFFRWNIENVIKYFKEKRYDLKIFNKNEIKFGCILFGIKQ